MKKRILFVGPMPLSPDLVWGGSVATSHNYLESMKLSRKYEVTIIDRRSFKTPDELKQLVLSTPHDLLHVDDAGHTAQRAFRAGLKPDVIGPISRAPNGVKRYTIQGEEWKSVYTPEWFYSAVVIRLNANEERAAAYRDKFLQISQGVDTNTISPVENPNRRFVLWAGDKFRPAKNFMLAKDIQDETPLPEPYEWKFMSGYAAQEYWDILPETALLVNTSKHESFCAALFEAKAAGVPTIYRENLHNDRFLDGRIQVPYTVNGYRNAILDLLSNPDKMKKEGEESRKYCEKHASFHLMMQSYEKAYDLAWKKKCTMQSLPSRVARKLRGIFSMAGG